MFLHPCVMQFNEDIERLFLEISVHVFVCESIVFASKSTCLSQNDKGVNDVVGSRISWLLNICLGYVRYIKYF